MANKVQRPVDLEDDDLVWVESLVKLEPTLHMMRGDKGLGQWLMTECDQQVRFAFGHSVMPFMHARQFARLCGRCAKRE